MATFIFDRFIGIDYSGAETPTSGLRGLRVYTAGPTSVAEEVRTPETGRVNWSRRGLAYWLRDRLLENARTLVGIDHGFAFPLRYFERYHLEPDWDAFLDDFRTHWPTDEDHMYVDFIRDGHRGQGAARAGDSRWRRLTEESCGAKSVFHFDVPGSVAKSTFAGLPWLRFIRHELGSSVHFWPFDGFDVSGRASVVAEVYPALWPGPAPAELTPDQRDARAIVVAMQRAQAEGTLAAWFAPDLTPEQATVARVEGWIMGLMSPGACRPAGRTHRDAKPRQLILDAVVAERHGRWSPETRRVVRSDAQRILEALIAEMGVEGAVRALDAQGFAGEAYRYLLTPLQAEAARRRADAGRSKDEPR